MYGNMMQMPLLISALLRHADSYHGDTAIVSRLGPGQVHRYTYRDAHRRARQLANALGSLGIARSSRVGTLAWNTHRHFELYFAISGMGAIINTVNPRLFPEQIEYIINHADDEIILFDAAFLPLVEKIAGRCPGVKSWIVLADADKAPESALELLTYESLLDGRSDRFEWPEFDENIASSLCYTSGTTGNPKGVLYSHRSTLLHTLGICLPDGLHLSAREVMMPVTAAAAGGGSQTGSGRRPRADARISPRQDRQMVAAGRCGVRRQPASHGDRQALQAHPEAAAEGLSMAGGGEPIHAIVGRIRRLDGNRSSRSAGIGG